MPKPEEPWARKHPKAKPEPSNRNVAWYRKRRAELIQEMGGKCVECESREELEFDHTKPRNWQPNKTSRWQRLRNYIKDWKKGELVLRCRTCNARKGFPDGQQELLSREQERNPF